MPTGVLQTIPPSLGILTCVKYRKKVDFFIKIYKNFRKRDPREQIRFGTAYATQLAHI